MGASTTIQAPAAGSVQRIPVEELAGHLATLESELSDGRSIEIMRGDAVIAEVKAKALPPSPPAGSKRYRPDFAAQLKEMWGDKVFDTDGTQIIREDRDARG